MPIVLEAVCIGFVQPAAAGIPKRSLNIAEGYTFGESPTFTRHLGIAYGSAVETGELLGLVVDAEIVDPEAMNTLLKRARRTERLLLGMLKQRREFHP